MDASTVTDRVVETTPLQRNAKDLELELNWFSQVLEARFNQYFSEGSEKNITALSIFDIEPPTLSDSHYASFIEHYGLSLSERITLVLSLAPLIRPRLMDIFFTKNQFLQSRYTEFGGLRLANGDYMPTGETLAFILGGTDLEARFSVQLLLQHDHFFQQHKILSLKSGAQDISPMKAALGLSEETINYFTTGQSYRPDLTTDFPASYIETQQNWDDLVLHPATLKQVLEIETWIQHGPTLMTDWGMRSRLRPGFRGLFYGPPGTGKTMTACLLGKATGRHVYKVDLSLVVSKYIGETEKNLGKVFDQAQQKDWILFFDEADAIFGKRTETSSSNDRHANQEVSYLLQRIETFDGIAILASNFKDNLDEAFLRRFEAMIFFPMPAENERLPIWESGFSTQAQLDDDIELEKLASEYDLTGGCIMNVVRYSSMQAIQRGGNKILLEDIRRGVNRELAKEGRVN